MTVRELLRETETALSRRESARFDARQLLLGLAKRDAGWLLSHGEDPADEELIAAVRDGAGRLAAGEPLQYILGSWDFYGLRFAVGPGVLIPRADTETVVEAALARLSGVERPVIWDLCSGSGAIALALWHSRPDAVVTAVELSEEALPYLRKNAAALSGGAVRVVAADVLGYIGNLAPLFAALKGYEVEEELAEAARAIETMGGALEGVEKFTLPDGSRRAIVKIRKVSPTPPAYPRTAAKMKKKPLV